MIRLKKQDYEGLANYMADRSRTGLAVMKPCPLCSTLLNRGERVHTVVFSGGDSDRETDQEREKSRRDVLVHMFGCPYCRPPTGAARRYCPVCRHEIPSEGYVVARMFAREKRKHVHVLGCTECRGGKRRANE
jgi:hypothetical protein